MSKQKISVLLFVLLLFSAVACGAALVDQISVLGGKVSSQKLVTPGERVKEGQILLHIESFAGPVPAARASSNGVIAEVLVKPGSQITSRQVVARLRPTGS